MQTAAPKQPWSIALYHNRGSTLVHSWGGQIYTVGKININKQSESRTKALKAEISQQKISQQCNPEEVYAGSLTFKTQKQKEVNLFQGFVYRLN